MRAGHGEQVPASRRLSPFIKPCVFHQTLSHAVFTSDFSISLDKIARCRRERIVDPVDATT
jgi:hypothetical protein